MRYLYSLLINLLSIFIPFYLKKLAKKDRRYNYHWHERFGFNLVNKSVKPIIWIHAVSVGETRAIAKLIELISEQFPNYQILITQMTTTGRQTACELYPNAMLHYIPFDMTYAVKGFYKTFKPKLGLIMETEIWPNLVHYAKNFNVPLYLINARLSNKSYQSYSKIKFFINPILNNFKGILCQDRLTYDNFLKLGYVNKLSIVGNIKFDLLINSDQFNNIESLVGNLKTRKKIIVFASTRDGEEQLILDYLSSMSSYINSYLIVIIPRHPGRFKLVEDIVNKKQLFKFQRRSDNILIDIDTNILLGDSLGEMFAYYNIADIVVMGGSFENFGCQNIIEPLYMNVPVIIGPSIYNFAKIVKDADECGCITKVNDMVDCFVKIDELLASDSKYSQMVENCNIFKSKYQGASSKIVNFIKVDL